MTSETARAPARVNPPCSTCFRDPVRGSVTPHTWPSPSCAPADDRSPILAQHLEHQLHGHQHGIVATNQTALRYAASVVDQGDIECGFEGAGGAGRNRAAGYRKLGREGLSHAAMGEARPNCRADTAMDPRARDALRAAEVFETAREILIGAQPQRESAAGRACAGARSRHGPEQLEIGLGIWLCGEHRTID